MAQEEPTGKVIEWREPPKIGNLDYDQYWIILRDEIRNHAHRNPTSKNWAVLEDHHQQWLTERDSFGRPTPRKSIEVNLSNRAKMWRDKLNLLSPTEVYSVIVRQGKVFAKYSGPLEPT